MRFLVAGLFAALLGCSSTQEPPGFQSSAGGGAGGAGATGGGAGSPGGGGGGGGGQSGGGGGAAGGGGGGGAGGGGAGGGGGSEPVDAGTDASTDADVRDVIVQDAVTQDSGGVSVTWQSGCWFTDQGQRFQAMEFTVQTPNPIPLEATLFFDTTCDPSQGTDNLNDTGGTINSGSFTFWFIHHPGEIQTSATWSLGGNISPCIDYSTAPDCP